MTTEMGETEKRKRKKWAQHIPQILKENRREAEAALTTVVSSSPFGGPSHVDIPLLPTHIL